VRFLHFIEHDTESVDSLLILLCFFGYPFVAPGEGRDAKVKQFFSGRHLVVEDPVGAPSSVFPHETGENEATPQYCEEKHYD